MVSLAYPLEQVLDIKKKRVDEAERVVKEKQQALEIELEKLRQREKDRDKVKTHEQDKLKQLRDELDQGTTSDKVQQMKVYLKVVKERLLIEEKKVADQKEQVKVAERNLEAAKEQLRLRRNEVDKMESHKKDWLKEAKKEMDAEEQKEMDEIGSLTHTMHKRMKSKTRE